MAREDLCGVTFGVRAGREEPSRLNSSKDKGTEGRSVCSVWIERSRERLNVNTQARPVLSWASQAGVKSLILFYEPGGATGGPKSGC